MKIKGNFVLKTVAGQSIVVPIGDAAITFNAMITLSESGKFLWENLLNDVTEDDLVKALLAEYEVSEDVARADTYEFLNKMREADLLDE